MNDFATEIKTEFGISFDGRGIRSEGTIGEADGQLAMALAHPSVGPMIIKRLLGEFGATKIFMYVGERSIVFFNSSPRRGLALRLPVSELPNLIKNCVSQGGEMKQYESGWLITFWVSAGENFHGVDI